MKPQALVKIIEMRAGACLYAFNLGRKKEIEMEKYLAGFIFKPTHREIHYLCSVRGRSYSGTYTRLPAEALQFDTREAALAAIEKKLKAGDRGRSGGYKFTAVTQKVGDYDEYRIHISV